MSDHLPNGWSSCRFTDVFDIQGGTQPPKKVFKYQSEDGYVRLLQIRDFGARPVPTYIPKRPQLKTCSPADILIGRYGASVGRICTGMEGAYNVALAKVIISPEMDRRFVYWLLQSPFFQNPILDVERSAQDGFNKEDLAEIDLPIAPKNEQRRIVANLEKLLTKVDDCQKRLDRIPLLLKRFRQAVLTAACSGKLTADWREQNSRESAAKFLEDVKPLRRKLWEEVEKRRIPHSVSKGAERWKARYKPFSPGSVSFSENLPEKWMPEKLDAVLAYIEAGKSFSCEERPPNDNEFGVPKVSAISWGEFDELESKTCAGERDFEEHLQIRNGDFLFSRANTIELVGACVIVRNIRRRLMLSDKSLRLSIAGSPVDFILLVLRSVVGRKQIEELATGNQNSMRNIGQDRIREIVIPFPPLPEQKEIVRRVKELFQLADQLEARYSKAEEHVDKLTQSILAKAFRGELVPQDPNDEPASVLLERIKAERNNTDEAPVVKQKKLNRD